MKEAAALMSALQRLIELEDDTADEYAAAGLAMSGGPYIEFGTCMILAGQSHDREASRLRVELTALRAEFGPGA